jgi:hypothetical protein
VCNVGRGCPEDRRVVMAVEGLWKLPAPSALTWGHGVGFLGVVVVVTCGGLVARASMEPRDDANGRCGRVR